MDQLQAMRVFSKVVEAGGFARAAERLGLSASAVSRHVADLEAHLRVRLLNRTTRRFSLTESGQAFLERLQQLLADLDEAEQAATRSAVRPHGTIRLNAALAFGVVYLAPLLHRYLERFPEVRVDVTLGDRVVDLVEEGYDVALRIGELRQANLVARRLGSTRLVACAAPEYLRQRGTPTSPADLAGHDCLSYTYASALGEWRFRDAAGHEHAPRVSGRLQSNNGNLLRDAALAGGGVVILPSFLVSDDLRAGRLTQVLPAWRTREFPISAVYASRKHLSAKVRSFVDFLAESFASIERRWQA